MTLDHMAWDRINRHLGQIPPDVRSDFGRLIQSERDARRCLADDRALRDRAYARAARLEAENAALREAGELMADCLGASPLEFHEDAVIAWRSVADVTAPCSQRADDLTARPSQQSAPTAPASNAPTCAEQRRG